MPSSNLKAEMFKDGYYKAFALAFRPMRPVRAMRQARRVSPAISGSRARPSMESCGIDVYQTAWNNGFPIQPLRHKGETQNLYCLMLVE